MAESDGLHLGIGNGEKGLGSERIGMSDEAVEGSFGGCQGDLLFEDDVDERGESGTARPKRGIANCVADLTDVRIERGKDIDRLAEFGDGETGLSHVIRNDRLSPVSLPAHRSLSAGGSDVMAEQDLRSVH